MRKPFRLLVFADVGVVLGNLLEVDLRLGVVSDHLEDLHGFRPLARRDGCVHSLDGRPEGNKINE